MSAELVYGIRVKLDDGIDPVAILDEFRAATDGHRTPEYIKMSDAIFAAKPNGFEVRWATNKRPWPVDSAGFTVVWLYTTYSQDTIAALYEKIDDQRREIERMRELAKQI